MLTHCHHLKSLSLPVDAMSPVPDLIQVAPGMEMADFCVCRSPAFSSSKLAQFFHVVFPSLHQMRYGYDHQHEDFAYMHGLSPVETLYFECWQEVWNTLHRALGIMD